MNVKILFYANFEAALCKLVEFIGLYDGTEIHQAGIIQAFEFTFEQCWKAIQKEAGRQGVEIASPKKALEWAMTAGWIATTGEAAWLAMLTDRNLTSHTYREKMAHEIVDNIRLRHAAALTLLLTQMKNKVDT